MSGVTAPGLARRSPTSGGLPADEAADVREIAREGARRMLAEALEAEIAD